MIKIPAVHTSQPSNVETQVVPYTGVKNRKMGTRTWMKFDATGVSEMFDCDRNGLLKRVTVPARDLRILGPIFSHSSHILGNYSSILDTSTCEFHLYLRLSSVCAWN